MAPGRQIVGIRKITKRVLKIETDTQINGLAIVNPKHVEPIASETKTELRQLDFDRGFGIGGLGRHVEQPIVPSIAAIERVEKMEARATYCRHCGQSDVFDGAMFTTGGGNICDDCF